MAQPTLSGVLVFCLSFVEVQQLLSVVGQGGDVTHLLITIELINPDNCVLWKEKSWILQGFIIFFKG